MRVATSLGWWLFALVLGLSGLVLVMFGQLPAIVLVFVAIYVFFRAKKKMVASQAGEGSSVRDEPRANRS